MSAHAAGPSSHDAWAPSQERPALAEMIRFYLFAGAAVVLTVLMLVLTVLDATR